MGKISMKMLWTYFDMRVKRDRFYLKVSVAATTLLTLQENIFLFLFGT
jgi:hypothetical protein